MCRDICLLLLVVASSTASLEIRCGAYHTCVFERGATDVKCWGSNVDGKLGYDGTNYRGDETNEMGSSLPFLNLGSNFVVEEMRLGGHHSCAMSDGRAMKCFGRNTQSQLGFDGVTTTGDALPFLEFGIGFNLSEIAVGDVHTCALSTDATLKCFGDNVYGQCGAGAGTKTRTISGPPSQINAIDLGTNFTPVDVDTWNYHVCVLSQQGTLKCFGENGDGQLGYGDTTDHGKTPESMGDGLPIVDLGSNFIVVAIATGGLHSCALSTTNTVKCWGRNLYGQCGTPHSTETGDNLPVLDLGADFVPTQLALGGWHTCILSEDARIICFGRNLYGQLGIGSTTDVDTPSTLTGIEFGSNFVPRQVSAGESHTCAVSTNDGIKCWGWNVYGQLGLGDTNDRGDDANELGDNLSFVDIAWPAPAPTTSPTSKQPTVSPSSIEPTTPAPTTMEPTSETPPATAAGPTTESPTFKQPTASPTASPTSLTPTTAMSSASPTASPSSTEPTTPAPTTVEPTSETPSPETVSPTAAPTIPTNEPTTATTFEPRTQSPTLTTLPTTVSKNTTVIVTIRTDSLSSTEILIAIANVYNLSLSLLTVTELSSHDDDDGFATVTVELLVAVASNTQLEFDVIEATLREAMVEEYGPDIEVDITEGDAPTQEQPEHPLQWLVPVAYCIVSVCCCFSVFGIVKCTLAKRRQHGNDEHDQPQAVQIELPERHAYGHNVHSESEVEEKKEDINPGAGGEPDMVMEDSVSNRDEGLRASVAHAAQPTTRMDGMSEDEFEVLDDDEDAMNSDQAHGTAGHTRNE